MQLQYLLEPSDFGDEVEAEQFFRHVEVLVRDVIEAHRGNLADVSAQKKKLDLWGANVSMGSLSNSDPEIFVRYTIKYINIRLCTIYILQSI